MDVITPAEKTKLEGRLRELLDNRPLIAQRIADARALGDLKENAEYHSTRELQGMEEAEIRRLEERLATAHVVKDENTAEGVVFLGSTVKIVEDGDDESEAELYRLVGESSGDDDDVIEVTASSPMGSALMKARVGEVIRVNAPRGVKKFRILGIV